MRGDPAPAGDVRYGASVADEISRGRLGKMIVHHPIQPAGLVLVALDPIVDLLRCVA